MKRLILTFLLCIVFSTPVYALENTTENTEYSVPEGMDNYNINNFLTQASKLGKISPKRQDFLRNALSYAGAISYQKGGKGVYRSTEKCRFDMGFVDHNNIPHIKGLDSAGFINWVYWNYSGTHSGFDIISFLNTTEATKINIDNIKPGDVVISKPITEFEDNEIAIYVCNSDEGNPLFLLSDKEDGKVTIDSRASSEWDSCYNFLGE